jgi:hypothetical protein
MADKTLVDLATKVLEKLFVVPEGQAPEADDSARVIANLPNVLDALSAREIVNVADTTAIQSAIFLDLAKVCAYELRDEFGLTGESLAQCKRAADEGVANIKTMTRGRPTYEPLKTLSF